jgi:hypothetical protein
MLQAIWESEGASVTISKLLRALSEHLPIPFHQVPNYHGTIEMGTWKQMEPQPFLVIIYLSKLQASILITTKASPTIFFIG